MPNNFLPPLLFSLTLLIHNPSFSQRVEFFRNISFDSSYTIVGIGQGYGRPVDSLPRFWFILDDPAEMNKLKNHWVFNRQALNYTFSDEVINIYVIKEKRLAAQTGLCSPNQKIINAGNGRWYPFDTTDLVRLHAAHPLRYHTEKKTFETWREYAAYGNTLLNDPKLLFFFEPSRSFEGSFDIFTSRTADPASPIFELRDINTE